MQYQQGATLIVVMIILLVITVLGTIAVKSGILGLKIATNSPATKATNDANSLMNPLILPFIKANKRIKPTTMSNKTIPRF